MALKHEAVTSNWNALVIQGAGRGKWVMDTVEQRIKEANMPGGLRSNGTYPLAFLARNDIFQIPPDFMVKSQGIDIIDLL